MTNQDILTKAIEKAEANGWRRPDHLTFTNSKGDFITHDLLNSHTGEFEIRTLLLDKDFAKALWGEEPTAYQVYYKVSASKGKSKSTVSSKPGLLEWQHHLQQMVIADDPIQYLGANL